MRVKIVGTTTFYHPGDVDWRSTDATSSGEELVEFAGRACYQSWAKPNPATATNAGYLAHLLDVGHLSVLEHGVVSLYLTGISRSLTHELVRHRHFSYSQLSQRYVDSANAEVVVPPELENDASAAAIIGAHRQLTRQAYDDLVAVMERKLNDVSDKTERRKRARQAARAVLPNMTETKVVVTGNYRAWLHFIVMRAAAPADHEIRRLAVEVLRALQVAAPTVFGYFTIVTLPDGTEAASTELVGSL